MNAWGGLTKDHIISVFFFHKVSHYKSAENPPWINMSTNCIFHWINDYPIRLEGPTSPSDLTTQDFFVGIHEDQEKVWTLQKVRNDSATTAAAQITPHYIGRG
jgi:hypothetical protein